jgi:hypothetical protein
VAVWPWTGALEVYPLIREDEECSDTETGSLFDLVVGRVKLKYAFIIKLFIKKINVFVNSKC